VIVRVPLGAAPYHCALRTAATILPCLPALPHAAACLEEEANTGRDLAFEYCPLPPAPCGGSLFSPYACRLGGGGGGKEEEEEEGGGGGRLMPGGLGSCCLPATCLPVPHT